MTAVNLDPRLIINKLIAELGEPWLRVHSQALKAVLLGQTELVKRPSPFNSCHD